MLWEIRFRRWMRAKLLAMTDAICSERLELEGGHGASGVLDQDLVHAEIYLLPGDEVAF